MPRPRSILTPRRPTSKKPSDAKQIDSSTSAQSRKSLKSGTPRARPNVSVGRVHDLVFRYRLQRDLRPGNRCRITQAERTCVLIQELDFHVMEAGFRSWARNVSPVAAKATVGALRSIGATDMAQTVQHMLSVRTHILRCDENDEEEYQALVRRAQLAKCIAALTSEYRKALRPTYTLLFTFIRETAARSPSAFPGLVLPKR